MIAEILDPECADAQSSEYFDAYTNVHEMMLKYSQKFQHYEFTMTGVLFRDRAHGQTGKADNNLELHPVLKLKMVRKLDI